MSFEPIDSIQLKRLQEPEIHRAPAPEVITYDCEHCGNCENPSQCVWGVQCPTCGADKSEQCCQGTRLVGLHEDRWSYAKTAAKSPA